MRYHLVHDSTHFCRRCRRCRHAGHRPARDRRDRRADRPSARPRRREVGAGHAEEDERGGARRPDDRLLVPVHLHEQRLGGVRHAGQGGPRAQGRRLSRLRRVGEGAARAAEPDVRRGDARAAARGGVDREPPSGHRAGAAAQHGGLRGGCGLPDRRRHRLSAADGVRRRARRAAGGSGRPRHRRGGARARRARQLRAGRRREQQPAEPRDQHAVLRRGSAARRTPGVRLHPRSPGGRASPRR